MEYSQSVAARQPQTVVIQQQPQQNRQINCTTTNLGGGTASTDYH